MKLLCVERDRSERLQVGGIYTLHLELIGPCPCQHKLVMVEELPAPADFACGIPVCGKCGWKGPRQLLPSHYTFLRRRFVPWYPEELKVTEQQVKELFQPQPNLEEVTSLLHDFREKHPNLFLRWRRLSNPYDTGS